MTADGSTTFSLLPFAVTLRLFFEMTATTENMAPAGFQHLVQPQAWLNRTLPLSATVTGCEVHLQTSVPPAKSFAPRPLSIDGCSERAIVVPLSSFSYEISKSPQNGSTHPCASGRT